MLYHLGYRLQANAKVTEGAQHADRDGRFRCINDQAAEHLAAGQPVISVDCKKKELVGDYANGGREWEPQGKPNWVGTHDFPDPEVGKAIPYGVYDLGANEGWVNVGDDHGNPAFAVASIARWWERMGKARYPEATRLMITADAGGSNGYGRARPAPLPDRHQGDRRRARRRPSEATRVPPGMELHDPP
jgi:hypothetical protein